MQNINFSTLADSTISFIADRIEKEDAECLIDIDFNGEVLVIKNDSGTFVVNKHSVLKEIWLASPLSGPHHFVYNKDKWVSRSGQELMDILQQELQIIFTTE